MPKNEIPHVTCEHLASLQEGGEPEHVVLDLRDRLEFEAGHIKGSLNVPRRELAANVASVLPEKGARVIVVVGPTHESEIEDVHATLTTLGYSRVEFLAGGFDRWCEIAPLELDEDESELTPEEMGIVGDDEIADPTADPHASENEPLL